MCAGAEAVRDRLDVVIDLKEELLSSSKIYFKVVEPLMCDKVITVEKKSAKKSSGT